MKLKQEEVHQWLYIIAAAKEAITLEIRRIKAKPNSNEGTLAYYSELLMEYEITQNDIVKELQYD